jgi:hypothetical protein
MIDLKVDLEETRSAATSRGAYGEEELSLPNQRDLEDKDARFWAGDYIDRSHEVGSF